MAAIQSLIAERQGNRMKYGSCNQSHIKIVNFAFMRNIITTAQVLLKTGVNDGKIKDQKLKCKMTH